MLFEIGSPVVGMAVVRSHRGRFDGWPLWRAWLRVGVDVSRDGEHGMAGTSAITTPVGKFDGVMEDGSGAGRRDAGQNDPCNGSFLRVKTNGVSPCQQAGKAYL